ncbi:hypothetical protein, variant [Aphanomyces invadans]|uniref:Uncharacterized protein n=1 Tax=Aphanomyces invadans TaxID=157072 RepID=A0A024TNN2_9STRA|nr:hypothetical protein H310_11152 [Aphanomyces invadans]XP_008875947.1 hypothetical protein, variant [Aphanomyces invadans]ETV95245.1 hypothetical protein H310_11152 [Aphanomyces invadans]ETV95246.1 hypothetical protein, variant [Aphanomyces invadans]|eukprot:XP_008875946.1 hypothetical protein H310_11152 [Aphanomyces invadans]
MDIMGVPRATSVIQSISLNGIASDVKRVMMDVSCGAFAWRVRRRSAFACRTNKTPRTNSTGDMLGWNVSRRRAFNTTRLNCIKSVFESPAAIVGRGSWFAARRTSTSQDESKRSLVTSNSTTHWEATLTGSDLTGGMSSNRSSSSEWSAAGRGVLLG